jgi:AAA domain-containing protein
MASKALARDLIRFLSHPVLEVSKFRVFQDFYCDSDTLRARAEKLLRHLEGIFIAGPSVKMYSTLLLWGDTGVGKTFLVKQAYKQLAEQTGKQIEYRELELHDQKLTHAMLVQTLDEIKTVAAAKDVFVFVDEVAAWKYSYAPLHHASDWTKKDPPALVFVFAGSRGNDMSKLQAHLRKRPQGKDLVERIRFLVSLPRLEPTDKIIIAASIARAQNVKRIDKAALFAIGWMDTIRSSRAVQQIIDGALSHPDHRGVITFMSIFPSPGEAFTFKEQTPWIDRFVREDITIRIE